MEKRKRLNYLLPHNNLDMRKPKIKFEKILTHLLARSLTPLSAKYDGIHVLLEVTNR